MADIDSHFAGVTYPGSLSLNKWTKATCNHGQDGPLVLSWLNSMPETVRARDGKSPIASNTTHLQRHRFMKQMLGLWRDTWWLWTVFLAMTVVFAMLVEIFFLLLLPCLPVTFIYFAFNRYDSDGNEKSDLGS